MDKRPEITLVTNKQNQQSAMEIITSKYKIACLLSDRRKQACEKPLTNNLLRQTKEPDYLDILRSWKQAD